MTKKNSFNIDIIPAIFIKYREDGNALLKCYLDNNNIELRAFEPNLIANIENPKYILLGIMTGAGVMGLNVCDGSEWEKYYHEKWSELLK